MRRKAGMAAGAAVMLAGAVAQAAEREWSIRFENFFRDQTKPLFIYAREQDGTWLAGVGSSRDPDRLGGKTFNRSWYYPDLSTVPIRDGAMKGEFKVHFTPDNWVPANHRSFAVTFEVDAQVAGDKMAGKYTVKAVGTDDACVRGFPKSGMLAGEATAKAQPPLPAAATFTCNLQGALVGGDPKFGDRCLVLALGVENGQIISASHGTMSQKFEVVGRTPFQSEGNTVSADRDKLVAHIVVPTKTLDMEDCTYVVDIDGRMFGGLLAGVYKLTCKVAGKADVVVDGSFDGGFAAGAARAKIDDRPWFAAVPGFVPPRPCEHPRLLFRRSDVPALRAKMETPEGKAILARLRQLLDGAGGDTMTTLFSPADQAYDPDKGGRKPDWDRPGVYTISHAAGYGLLYQLTGDRKYAEFGRQCFEKAIEGKRDRDDRYSFKKSGGALRAGPSQGWYAVGYDLCYDGWDEETRKRITLEFVNFAEGGEGKTYNLEALARGTMPPGSNHFGMQVGGASLVLLAISGEPWVDQKQVDMLLAVAQQSVIRNLVEGFGDGGFFAEGDGTGSMSSHIVYLSALLGWKNAAGLDFINVERPNARMTALKWIYGTVFRGGPDFWPIRGAYGHNTWSRHGLSGGGYLAHGFAAVTDEQKAALKWYYNHFMRDADERAGGPWDTISPYPHVAVCAFVNWPTGIEERNPAEVLPLCYRDSSCGFYLWRNRWKDGNDTVISVLSSQTKGYMGAKPDKDLKLNTMGKHITWGTSKEGDTKHWWSSKMGETSSLTLSDGTCLAVDFTGASGADAMLVTTGKAEGQSVDVAGAKLTFYFPTAATPPQVTVEGDAAVVGKQKVALKDGNLTLAVAGR